MAIRTKLVSSVYLVVTCSCFGTAFVSHSGSIREAPDLTVEIFECTKSTVRTYCVARLSCSRRISTVAVPTVCTYPYREEPYRIKNTSKEHGRWNIRKKIITKSTHIFHCHQNQSRKLKLRKKLEAHRADRLLR